MSKRANLAEMKTNLARDAGSVRAALPTEAAPHQAAVGNAKTRPDRVGKSNVTGYFPNEVKKQLRMMAAEQDKTIQQLLAEALNGLFAKYGKGEIAPLDRE